MRARDATLGYLQALMYKKKDLLLFLLLDIIDLELGMTDSLSRLCVFMSGNYRIVEGGRERLKILSSYYYVTEGTENVRDVHLCL